MFKHFRNWFGKRPQRQPIVRRRTSLAVELLHERVLPSATVALNPSHVLVIQGDAAANHVTVSQVDTSIKILADGKSFSFDSAAVQRILFNGKGGNDVFVNNTNIASVALGGAGNDVLIGGSSNDVLIGAEGNDTLRGGAGDDNLQGGNGNDRMGGGDDNDHLNGGAGNDNLQGGNGDDVLVGGAGKDIEHGGAGNDFLAGNAGNDNLSGDDGDDILIGGADNDIEHSGAGNDFLAGSAGNDNLSGDDGNDSEHGGAGNDNISGDAGDDDLSGDTGNDHLNGGSGADHMNGGAGVDQAVGDDSDTETEIEHNDLGAALTGATSAVGFAEFDTSVQTGVNFKVDIEHAPANQTFNVFVGGTNVGSITTNGEGEGKLTLKLTAPTINAGSVVTVKDLQNATLLEGTFGQSHEDNGNDV